MPIAVSCKACGASFRAKDDLAGKTVRCPKCKEPLRIPSAAAPAKSAAPPGEKPMAATPSKSSTASPPKSAPSPAAPPTGSKPPQKLKPVITAEAEAEARAEMNKLVAAYDQLSGRDTPADGKKGSDKKRKLGEAGTKVTVRTKLADRLGILKSTLFMKYVLLVLLIGGGGYASTVLIHRVMSHSEEATTVHIATDSDIDRLYNEAEQALQQKRFAACRDRLEEIKRSQPYRVNNVRYKTIEKALHDALMAPK